MVNSAADITPEDRIDRLFEEAGGCGLFQVFAYVAIAIGMSAPSWFIYEFGYLTQAPDAYVCTYAAGVTPDPSICTKENICDDDPRIASWEADPDSPDTLDNWQQKLDLTCVDSWKISMIGASLFIGMAVTLLWLPSIADRRGRKQVFWLGMACQQLLYTGLMLTHSLAVMIVLVFLFGMLSSVRLNVGYIYLMEVLPKKAQTNVTSCWSVQEAAIYVVATIYFWKISKQWFWYCFIGYVWQLTSLVCLFWMPESQRYLIKRGRTDEARKAFMQIARTNGREINWEDFHFKTSKMNILKTPRGRHIRTLEIVGFPASASQDTIKSWVSQQVGKEVSD